MNPRGTSCGRAPASAGLEFASKVNALRPKEASVTNGKVERSKTYFDIDDHDLDIGEIFQFAKLLPDKKKKKVR